MKLNRVVALLSLAFLACVPVALHAQNGLIQQDGHALYVEAGGAGLVYTLNCDIRLKEQLSLRIGLSGVNETAGPGFDETVVGVLLMPVHGQILIGGSTHKLELGAGPVLGFSGSGLDAVRRGSAVMNVNDGVSIAAISTSIGYRRHPKGGGVLVRAALTPFYSDSRAQLWGGVSIGWAM